MPLKNDSVSDNNTAGTDVKQKNALSAFNRSSIQLV